MLTALENFLISAVHTELPTSKIITGSSQIPANNDLPLLNFIAHDLHTLPAHHNDEQTSPAFFSQRVNFTGDGNQQDFVLPVQGDVLEVELTSEKLAKLRDEYWQDDNTLRFYQAPTGQFNVLIKGAPAQGYQSIRPSITHLTIEAWHSNYAEADTLLSQGLAAALKAFVDLDRIELTRNELGFSLRLLKPMLELNSLEHDLCMKAKLIIRADLELNLAFGNPATPQIIKTIVEY